MLHSACPIETEVRPATGVRPFVARRLPPCVAGNRACRRPFRPPSNRPPTPCQAFLRFVFRSPLLASSESREIRRVPGRRPERPPARLKASSWLDSHLWGKMASCCRLVIGMCEAFIPFHGPKAHADRQDCLPHEFCLLTSVSHIAKRYRGAASLSTSRDSPPASPPPARAPRRSESAAPSPSPDNTSPSLAIPAGSPITPASTERSGIE
jgi:hypothetical protein